MRKAIIAVLVALGAYALWGLVTGFLVSWLLYVYIKAAVGQ